ncbi:MAG: hypothetical protein A3J38_07855 [Gammaproteobacteria bacterium RIFCSPHIGHO2_12_FULL_45_9]|nr:MAG: hypothetical protein A3J38_07855 [Gammaproteobacteria bacterium RIFCSPHIGHO2_12_FULL_45_9]
MLFMGLSIGFTVSLSSCVVPAVLAVGAAAGVTGKAVADDSRSMKTIQQDHNSTQFAQNWLNQDPALEDHSHVTILVFNHVALLVGQADTSALRDRAYQIASRTPNVKRIYNEITIESSISKTARMKDSWITTKVRTTLLAEKGLNSSTVTVLTENSTVYLIGMLSRSQAELAVGAAQSVDGVSKVIKVFEYTA